MSSAYALFPRFTSLPQRTPPPPPATLFEPHQQATRLINILVTLSSMHPCHSLCQKEHPSGFSSFRAHMVEQTPDSPFLPSNCFSFHASWAYMVASMLAIGPLSSSDESSARLKPLSRSASCASSDSSSSSSSDSSAISLQNVCVFVCVRVLKSVCVCVYMCKLSCTFVCACHLRVWCHSYKRH